MSFLFGGHAPREDAELADVARRQREAFARDIGDEHTLAWSRQRPEGPRRPRRWTPFIFIALVLFATLGAIPLLHAGNGGGIVRAQCDHPVIGVSADQVAPGRTASWQVAGPSAGPYVVALDTGRIAVNGSSAVAVDGGRVLAGPFTVTDCRSAQTLFQAPNDRGKHQVTLYRRTATGYSAIAQATLSVG